MESNPNCAICNAPALPECPCESERLTIAVRQAEKRAMDDRLHHIREWVIAHARAQILQSFNTVTSHRKIAHKKYLASLPFYDLYVQYAGHPPLHPRQLQALKTQIHEAELHFKRGIDADWKDSVVKYPEVLNYYYSLVEIRLPNDRSSSVLEPQLGIGKDRRRIRERRPGVGGLAPPVAPAAPPGPGWTYI
ncbi:hypothetical protein EV356DRAFT_454888 [Viridothelium virens]|uniref:Uncharacterized protein n=1 Tax=Viridothelium virens TaxID=1048519 RepID=A0A6A6GVX5_VIRVR|nr:hypothetical protein EV356DRAFT_454888 [Viridothelium virens]